MNYTKQLARMACAMAAFLVCAGCCTTSTDDRASRSRSQQIQESDSYKFILPVSTEMYDIIFRIKSTTIAGIGNSLKERFSDNPAIANYASRILDQEKIANEEWERNLAELNEAAAGGGVICEFEWNDGKTREVGLLVLKSGKVVKRQPWFTDHSPKSPAGTDSD